MASAVACLTSMATLLAPSAAAADDSFTIVVIPDTQSYVISESLAATFTEQTEWIVDQQDELDTRFVIHVGDVVESHPNTTQWARASASMAVLDDAGIPNSVLPGNHDMDLGTGAAANYDATFPVSRYSQASWNSADVSYGGYLGQNQFGADPINRQNKDNYALLSVGDLDLLILNIEYEMPQYSLAWAQRVIDAHPDRTVIMATHGWITTTGGWIDWRLRTDTTTTTAVAAFNDFVHRNCSIRMIVSGHMHDGDIGEARRTDLNACGQPVQQVLSDYQSRSNGGDGWLRYYTFHPAEGSVDAFTYSPTLERFETDADSQFSMPIDLEPVESSPVTLVGSGASWRWQGAASGWPSGWTQVGFNDSGWASGAAPLGFGSASIVTSTDVPPPTSNRPRSTVFRHVFTVEDPAQLSDLVLTTRADDGMVIYVNGTEVNRTRLPSGTLSATTYATAAPSTSAAVAAPVTVSIPASLLQQGSNVIAVSVHLNYRATADTSFAASLSGMRQVPEEPEEPEEPPAAPVLSGSATGPNSVRLEWTSDAVGLTRFEVRRDGVVVATLPPSARSHVDSGLAADTSYDYRVTAVAGALSTPSAVVAVRTAVAPQESSPVTLVGSGASWRWQGAASGWPSGWTQVGFNDSGWASGAAPLGFGSASIVTSTDVPPPTSNRPRSTVFRHVFTVEDPAQLSDLVLTTRADDGMVIYVNGTEVNRTRLPSGTLSATTYATAAPSTSAAVAAPVTVSIPASLLQQGSNVIAVSVHLNYRATADTSFALVLAGMKSA